MAGNMPNIGPIDPSKPVRDVAQGQDQQQQPQGFDQYMQGNNMGTKGLQNTQQVSPMDLAQSRIQTTPPTLESVNAQMQSNMGSLGDIQNHLNTKNLRLKQSQKYLLRNKLTDANENIRTAVEQAGEKPTELANLHARQNPIMKFMGIVQNSQINLEKSQALIANLNSSGKAIDPGRLLLIQVKLAKAQQDLEYSSVLLSKAVDDVKMLFNVQL